MSLSTPNSISFFDVQVPGGMGARISTYGATVQKLLVPTQKGTQVNIVAGMQNDSDYTQNNAYLGCVVGRFANRLQSAVYRLGEKQISVSPNEHGRHHLHGGYRGFDKRFFDILATDTTNTHVKLVLQYTSPDGEEGYEGTLTLKVTYTFTQTQWIIEYEASTDKPTIVNPTQHTYFNLSGFTTPDILNHCVQINASEIIETDEEHIPTGRFLSVRGTDFDFMRPVVLHTRKNFFTKHSHAGYDHCFVLKKKRDNQCIHIATIEDKENERTMKVFSDAVGIQFYTANYFDKSILGTQGQLYDKHSCFCVETQLFPNAPNVAHFPSAVLLPKERFYSQTIYQFDFQS